jgi:hypothetical protein
MKFKALITALVLGSSSLAMAAPGFTTTTASFRPAPDYRSPVVLASKLSLNKAQKRTVLQVESQRRFTQLQISGVSGRTEIQAVTITFANGQKQVVRNLDKMLTGNAAFTIDLEGRSRQIESISIKGESAGGIRQGWRRPNAIGAIKVVAL